jgi:membrane-associated phospholipid phosphatase
MNEIAVFIAQHPVLLFLALSTCLLALCALLWQLVQRMRKPLWERGTALWQRLTTAPRMQALLQRHRWLRQRTPTAFAGGYLLLDLLAGFALVAAALSLFLEIADEIGVDETLGRFDNALAEALRQTLDDGTLQAFALLTRLGDVETLTLLCVAVAAVLLVRGKRLLAASWIAAVAGNGLLNRLLKGLFERSRPLHDHGWTLETSWSFPSGHSSGALVTYGMLAYLLSRATPRIWHLPLTLLAIWIALLVGYSRIVLQVHFFSDVLAGFISGATWLLVCIASAEVVRAQLTRPTPEND